MNTDDLFRQRRFRRRTVRVVVEYASAAGHCRDTATTLGGGGLFVESDRPLATGSMLKISFQLPGRAVRHEIEGQVVWSRLASGAPAGSPGMGVEFTDRKAAAALARELESLE